MCKRHKRFVIFLDVDGVLNTTTTVQKTQDGYTGIDDARVEVLAKTIEKIGGADDYVYLISKLALCGLSIDGQTQDQMYKRGEGILKYLKAHPEIEEYVVLDDCRFDFQKDRKLWEHLLLTNGIENAQFASETPAVEAIVFRDYLKLF